MTIQPDTIRYARRFVLRRPLVPDIPGVEFPSGAVLADDPYGGLMSFVSIGDLVGPDPAAAVHWADEPQETELTAVPDPLAVLQQVEQSPRYELVPGCPHCPDGHTPPDQGQPWGAFVGPERDGDGQPTTIHVARSAGAHVAESDAQWIRDRLNQEQQ